MPQIPYCAMAFCKQASLERRRCESADQRKVQQSCPLAMIMFRASMPKTHSALRKFPARPDGTQRLVNGLCTPITTCFGGHSCNGQRWPWS